MKKVPFYRHLALLLPKNATMCSPPSYTHTPLPRPSTRYPGANVKHCVAALCSFCRTAPASPCLYPGAAGVARRFILMAGWMRGLGCCPLSHSFVYCQPNGQRVPAPASVCVAADALASSCGSVWSPGRSNYAPSSPR